MPFPFPNQVMPADFTRNEHSGRFGSPFPRVNPQRETVADAVAGRELEMFERLVHRSQSGEKMNEIFPDVHSGAKFGQVDSANRLPLISRTLCRPSDNLE